MPGTASSWQTIVENTRGQRSLMWLCHCSVWWKTRNSSWLRPQRYVHFQPAEFTQNLRNRLDFCAVMILDPLIQYVGIFLLRKIYLYMTITGYKCICVFTVCTWPCVVFPVRTPWLLWPLCGGGKEPEGAVSVPRSHASSPVRRHGTTQDTKAM